VVVGRVVGIAVEGREDWKSDNSAVGRAEEGLTVGIDEIEGLLFEKVD